MWREIRYSLRQIQRNKLFSGIVILLLAIGIGANTLIFSFVNTLLLKPLPVRHPENLFLLQKMREKQVRPDTWFSYRQFEQLRQKTELFSAVVAEQAWSSEHSVPFTSGDSVRLVSTQIVSPNYFSELGVQAIAGRTLTEEDAAATSNIPVMLSYQFWQSQFGGHREIIGQTIRLKNYPFLVAGVLPRDFHSLDIERAPDVRLPISAAQPLFSLSIYRMAKEYYSGGFQLLARLAPGVTQAQAAAAVLSQMRATEEAETREAQARQKDPQSKEDLEELSKWARNFRMELEPAGQGVSQLRTQFSRALTLLMGGVCLLMLAICANVAGLLLAKAEERKRDIAVRLSMGANRWQIIRQLLIESLALALPGCLLGIALAYSLSPVMVRLLPLTRGYDVYATPAILSVTPDLRVLLFSIALAFLCAIIFGMAPAWRGTKLDLNAELKGNTRTSTRAVPGIASVAIQVGLSVVLLTIASLMLRTFWNLDKLNPGFDRAHIVEFAFAPKAAGYSDAQTGVFVHELRERVSTLPGVRSAAYSDFGVMRGVGLKATVAPHGVVLPKKTFLNTSMHKVTTSYFQTMGIPLLAGRPLEGADPQRKPVPIVVNQAFVKLFFSHEDALGKFMVNGTDGTKPPTQIIVGVCGTAKYRTLREKDEPTLYGVIDERKNTSNALVLYVRTHGDPSQMIGTVRNTLRGLDARVPLMEVFTLEQEVQNSLWQERLVALLSGFFGMVALVLAGIGLYGSLAYSVAQRSRELGIRIAIGAQTRHVVQTVCTRMLWSVAIGLGCGVLATTVLVRVTRHLLYGVDPLDSMSFSVSIGILLACVLLAAAIPSRRAAKTNPAVALKDL